MERTRKKRTYFLHQKHLYFTAVFHYTNKWFYRVKKKKERTTTKKIKQNKICNALAFEAGSSSTFHSMCALNLIYILCALLLLVLLLFGGTISTRYKRNSFQLSLYLFGISQSPMCLTQIFMTHSMSMSRDIVPLAAGELNSHAHLLAHSQRSANNKYVK